MVLEEAEIAGLEFEIQKEVERAGIHSIAFPIQQPALS